ncbi:hypothetical protein BC351_20485 [Paenibacillus ferrarius]|uniref:Uncharacterized protein n=1 Tax=Paenibacillus ferrarius TaxID=1469647 RepID=A0A1V4HN92_9BACL|nr:hypothetical protein BC351_20485 [Paenibacillus ferrarius]
MFFSIFLLKALKCKGWAWGDERWAQAGGVLDCSKVRQLLGPYLIDFEKPAKMQAFSIKSGENVRKPAIMQAF